MYNVTHDFHSWKCCTRLSEGTREVTFLTNILCKWVSKIRVEYNLGKVTLQGVKLIHPQMQVSEGLVESKNECLEVG
jgi:hypothetical protein